MRTSHYSIIVVVTMVNIILKKNIGGHYFKKPKKKNIIYKVIHSKNYEKLNKLLFKAHGN